MEQLNVLDVDEGRVPRAPRTCGRSRYTIGLLREYMSRTYSNQFSYDGKLKMGIWGVAKEFFILLLSLLVIHKQQYHLRYLVSGSSPYVIPITLSLLILIPTLLYPV